MSESNESNETTDGFTKKSNGSEAKRRTILGSRYMTLISYLPFDLSLRDKSDSSVASRSIYNNIKFLVTMKVIRQRNSRGTSVLTNRRKLLGPLMIFACAILLCLISANDSSPMIVMTTYKESTLVGLPPVMFQNATSDGDLSLHNTRLSENKKQRPVIWSRMRADRSGAAIQDMLMCHAYAYQNNMIYGGACARHMKMQQKNEFLPNHLKLLDAVGLSKVLQFRCPPKKRTALRDRYDYIKNDTGIFTSHYLKYLQNMIDYPPKPKQRLISAHIRRGDITPCRPRTRGYNRYLPNQHFLRLIDRYNPQNDSKVVIYSESQSFETFDDFRNRGFEVVLDGSISDVWKGILVSDVVILSRSSFSLVPAIMSKGQVVFTPFWHSPLPHWDVVEEEFINRTLDEFRRLKATCPNSKKKNKELIQ